MAGSLLNLLLYVDEAITKACSSCLGGGDFKVLLSSEFDMKDFGETKKILGMEILKDRSKGVLYLSQRKYIEEVGNTTNANTNNEEDEPEDDYSIRLYRAALSGDWEVAKQIHINHPDCFTEIISKNGDTALHIASAAGHYSLVKEILLHLDNEQLEMQNSLGNNAFCLAAASGVLEIVQEMQERNSNLPNIPGSSDMKPILMAALLGHGEMVLHLMTCFDDLIIGDRIDLLIFTINTDLYEIALDILDKDERLAIMRNGDEQTPLHVLSQKTQKKGVNRINNWRIFCNLVTNNRWRKQEEDKTKLKLALRLWKIVIKESKEMISQIISFPKPGLVFIAIELGNYEFVSTLIRHYPDLIWETDDQNRTIFHAAIQCRQEKIFSHIHELHGIKHLLAAYMIKSNKNNILHLAAMLPSTDRLNVVSGAALQMQRELLWFQVIEKIVHREYADLKNNPPSSNNETKEIPSETPRAMFTREHKPLRHEGEKWMRDTATSCMVVATLVATVVFQAIFQLPNHRKNNKLFWVLVISDAFSLVSSTASILTFLGILTSRYAEQDFVVSLPLKLMIGLALLFFSIMTMLLAFTVTIYIIFKHLFLVIIIGILAGITGTFYIIHHLPLLIDAYCSTFRSNYFFRPKQMLFID